MKRRDVDVRPEKPRASERRQRRKLPTPVGALDICTHCGKVRGPVKFLPAFKRGVICGCPNSPSAINRRPLSERASPSEGPKA